jgi:hypothetical protein
MMKMDPDHRVEDHKDSENSMNMNSGSYMNENLGVSIIDEGRLDNMNKLHFG